MTNKFGIPEKELEKIRSRDKKCPYCHIKITKKRGKHSGTIEHLNRYGPFNWIDGKRGLHIEDIIWCCNSCNASRSDKKLQDWFKTEYCITRNINEKTVTDPVKKYLNRKRKKKILD